MPRTTCAGCGRPPIVCICAAMVTVATRTRVVVLQHPREADNPIGTAWLVERCFGATRIVGVGLERDRAYVAALTDKDAPAILLSPGPGAIDLHSAPPRGPVTLVVVDGTWAQARSLLRANPSLARLPHYAFTPASPSNYRIRREPSVHCVSTIEATVAALEVLESEVGHVVDVQAPLRAFDAMVDHQVRIARERQVSRHVLSAAARSASAVRKVRSLTPLAGRPLVVVHGEVNAWPRGSEHGVAPELVHVVAERLPSGERFEAFIAPTRPLSPRFTSHTRVAPEHVLEGVSRDAFRACFLDYLRDDDTIADWGGYVVSRLREELSALPTSVDLRTTAIRVLGRPEGDASDTADALGVAPESAWAIGRTGERLTASLRVARALTATANP